VGDPVACQGRLEKVYKLVNAIDCLLGMVCDSLKFSIGAYSVIFSKENAKDY
jgi:hypothetical protein